MVIYLRLGHILLTGFCLFSGILLLRMHMYDNGSLCHLLENKLKKMNSMNCFEDKSRISCKNEYD